jgi:hypothetical protein
MVWVATDRPLAVQVAVPPESAAAAQSTVLSAVKETVPVGVPDADPDAATVAVKVTVCPRVDGLGALPSVVADAPLLTT